MELHAQDRRPVDPPRQPTGDLYRGFGETFTRAVELAVTPALFGVLGYLLDRWVGVLPLFTTLFVLVALVGIGARTWYAYVGKMRALEAQGPWARNADRYPAAAAGTERVVQ